MALGLDDCLYLGNLDALRDWGHARDYVEMQWLMLQQENPEDFVIATGMQYSVREFVSRVANALGMVLEWRGSGISEHAVLSDFTLDHEWSGPSVGSTLVQVDPKYYRPAEVETLLGDASNAKHKLGWQPRVSFEDMIIEMVDADLETARAQKFMKENFR